MKKKIMIGVSILVFLLALVGTLYPVISDYWNTRHQSEVQVEYEKQMESMEDSELTAALEAANAYHRQAPVCSQAGASCIMGGFD